MLHAIAFVLAFTLVVVALLVGIYMLGSALASTFAPGTRASARAMRTWERTGHYGDIVGDASATRAIPRAPKRPVTFAFDLSDDDNATCARTFVADGAGWAELEY